MADLADELAKLSPEKIERLRNSGLRKIFEEEERKARVRMDDPHGTVRYLDFDNGGGSRMFIVRRDNPEEEEGDPYWEAFPAERSGIPVEDGFFDPAKAPVIGRLDDD